MAALLVFNGAFFGLVHNLFTIRHLNRETAALDKEYEKLNAAYDKIQKGDMSYIEDAARARYHMSAKGEYEFRLEGK